MHFYYIDGFLIIDPPHSPACKQNLNSFIQQCDNLGIPLVKQGTLHPALVWFLIIAFILEVGMCVCVCICRRG